jgi:hypothetical protein
VQIVHLTIVLRAYRRAQILHSSPLMILIRIRPWSFLEDSTLRRPAPAPEFLGPGLLDLFRVIQCRNLARGITRGKGVVRVCRYDSEKLNVLI